MGKSQDVSEPGRLFPQNLVALAEALSALDSRDTRHCRLLRDDSQVGLNMLIWVQSR